MQTPSWNKTFGSYESLSVNGATIKLVGVPVLTLADPSYVINPVQLERIVVTGINFFSSQTLVCFFEGVASPAVFLSTSQVVCRVSLKQNKTVNYLSVSNDKLLTVSNSLPIIVLTQLPRITAVQTPVIIFADGSDITLRVQGRGLASFAQANLPSQGLLLQAWSETDLTTGECQALSDVLMECKGLKFSTSEVYSI